MIANGGHTVRNSNASQTCATIESTIADCFDTVGDGYTLQIMAALERTVTDKGNTIWNGDIGSPPIKDFNKLRALFVEKEPVQSD